MLFNKISQILIDLKLVLNINLEMNDISDLQTARGSSKKRNSVIFNFSTLKNYTT